jgi:hypothetical protein
MSFGEFAITVATRLIEHKSDQTNYDSESLKQFKISEDLEEVSITKSVPNLISYLHEFFSIPSYLFEIFSFGSKFNSEIADMRSPPVSRRFLRRARLSGPRAGVPTAVPTAPPVRAAPLPHMRLS